MQIFIAGTGRCGTTQLNRIMGEHPEISALAEETRFIVDPGGLEDLVPALSTRYTPFHADDALRRFESIIMRRLTGREQSAFVGWRMHEEVGTAHYWQWANDFLDALTRYTFDEVTPPPDGGPEIRVTRLMGRWFPDRAELVACCRDFVERLLGGLAARRGKPHWCEKTPFNLLSMAFLWELFPDATIVHIMRHPMQVVASLADQPWTPADVQQICWRLEPVYRRWLAFRDTHDLPADQYVELRLEDAADNWPKYRAELFNRLGVADAETPSTLEVERTRHAGRVLTRDERELVERQLGFAVAGMGY